MAQTVWQINPYAPSAAIKTEFMAWEEALEVPTPIGSLFSYGSAVNTMSYTTAEKEAKSWIWAVGTSARNATATTGLTISASTSSLLTNYSSLKIGDEIVIVKSVNRTANTIEVYARWEGSTVWAIHAIAAQIDILAYNLPLWVKDIEAAKKSFTTRLNYVAKNSIPSVSFVKEDVSVDREFYWEKGYQDYVSEQILDADRDLLIARDKSLLRSTAQAGTGSWETGTPAMTKWLMEEATERANIKTTFGSLSDFDKINDALIASQGKHWKANVLLCSLAFRNAIQKLWAIETQLPAPLNRLAIAIWNQVSVLNTNVGQLTIVWSADMPDDKAIVLNTKDLSRHPLVWFTNAGWDKKTTQESARNDQAFNYDTLMQGWTVFLNTNKNMTLITGITY